MEPVYFSSFLCQDYQQMLNCMKLFKATLAEMFIHKMQSSFHLQEHKIFHKESIVLDNLYTITDFKDQKCFIFFCKFSIIKTPNKINIMNMFLFKQIIVTPPFFWFTFQTKEWLCKLFYHWQNFHIVQFYQLHLELKTIKYKIYVDMDNWHWQKNLKTHFRWHVFN